MAYSICDPHTKCIIDVGLMSKQLFSGFKIQTVVDQSDYSIWSHDPLQPVMCAVLMAVGVAMLEEL